MAEYRTETAVDGCETNNDEQNKVSSECTLRSAKRTSSRCPSPEPPLKTPVTLSMDSASLQPSGEGQPDGSLGRMQDDQMERINTQGSGLSPRTRRKSWRRSARGRRSLPSLPNSTQGLYKDICLSLPEEERLEKLMEASMTLAVQKLEATLWSTPGAVNELYQRQVELVQKEWHSLAKEIRESSQGASLPPRDPEVQKAMEQIKKSIQSLQWECELWESLLLKHRSRAEDLARHVEQGQAGGLALDPNCLTKSSQSQLILSKPDYNGVVCKQKMVLDTMALMMDTYCKMLREVLSYQERCQALVQETSSRLASAAGFQNLSSSPVRQLLTVAPQSGSKLGPRMSSS